MGKGTAGTGRARRKPMLSSLAPPSQPFMLHDKYSGCSGPAIMRSDTDEESASVEEKKTYAAHRYVSDAAASRGSEPEMAVHGVRRPKAADGHMAMRSDLPQPGMKFHVHGSIRPPPPRETLPRRMPSKSDTRLAYGRLSIFCYDRMSSLPIPGCAVCITTLDRWNGDGQLNSGSTFGRATVSTEDGMVVAKVLSGRAYVLSATCTGYYPFGKLGERLLIHVEDGKTCKLKMAMVPIKVGVIITAKEMMPDREAAQHRFNIMAKLGDEAAQHGITQEVAALMNEEQITLEDKHGIISGSFTAFSLPGKDLLEVRKMATGELIGYFSTDNDGRSFFYGPRDGAAASPETNISPGSTSSPRKAFPALSSGTPDFAARLEGLLSSQAKECDILQLPGSTEQLMQPDEAEELTTLTHLEIGWYTVSLNDPTRMVVFSDTRNKDEEKEVDVGEHYSQEVAFEVNDPGPTYRAGANRYNISLKSKSIEDIYTDNTSMKFVGKGPGKGVYLPLELYCRKRPKIEVQIFDLETERDVGSRESVYFQIDKVVRTFREVGDDDFVNESQGTRPWAKTAMQTLLPRHGKKYNSKDEPSGASGWVEVSTVNIFSGRLNNTDLIGCNSLKEMYGLPGERYSVTVQGQDPYVEWTQRLTSVMTWDEHQFSFYFHKKVTLVVGIRERYSHAPCRGRTVRVEVVEVPPPPVPPPPRMWRQEGEGHYARRILEHVLDWVVESHEESTIDGIARDFEMETDDDGLVRVAVPPLSLVRVLHTADGEYEDEEMVEDVEINEQPEQFVGFNLEPKCFLHTTMIDAATNEPLEGVKIQLIILEDELQNLIEPPKVVIEDYTDSHGKMETLDLRAGTRVMVKVLEAPFYHLAPRYAPNGSDSLAFRITGTHHCEMFLPRKPRIKVFVYDCTSGEEVQGIKFRVLVDRNLSRASQEVAHQLGAPGQAKSEFELQQMDTWGEEMYRCYTGSPDVHRLFVDTQCKVGVQVIPMWPFRTAPQMHVQYSGGAKGCSPFVFWIVRDPSAAKFWNKRDSAVHDLWEADGTPLGPPWHYMARLQPIISSARALYSLREELVQLRPGWHPATRYKQETVLNMFDNDGGDGGIFSEEGEGAAKEGEEPRSAFLLEGSLDPKESLRRRAVDHMRMGDPARLPIEEKKLMELLSLWGCFKHVKGTSCECHNPAHRVNPYLMKNPDPKERRKFVGAANLEKEPSGRLRIGDQSVDPGQYVAAEVLEHIASNLRSKSPVKRLMPGPSAGLLDEEDREAKYCESPFFTLWLPDGQGIHVGVHDGLYRDLVLCMEKLRAGMRACDAQLAKIEAYNGTRSTDGAYVFGMETAETGRGGVFLVDCSAAMPPNALSFVARQLAFLLEHWYANSGGGRIPLYNVVAATGNNIAKLCDHLKPVNGKMMNNVPPWLTSQTDTTQVGFNMVLALKMALRLADGKVPVHVITGGMSNGFHGFRAEEVFQVIENDMKGHIAANESLMPIFGIEVTPVPITLLLQPKSSQWEEAQKNAKSVGGKSHGAPSSKSADTSHLYVGDAATTTSGPEDPYVGTTDIFMRLAIHLSDGRTRLLEIFRQEDKNCDQSLNSAELAGLLRRVYPGITPAQVRYMQVMLDKQGDDKITYRQLSETIKLCKKAGVQVKAREGLELVDVLRQLAMKQIRETLSVKELFDCYDTTKSGFMGKSQVQRMITTLMPAANTHEVSDMADAFWGIDFNGDNRISRDEFSKAMKQGGADILDLRSSNPLETGVAGFEAAELQAGAAHAGIQLGKPRDNKKGDPGPLEDASPMEDLGNGSAVKELMFQVCAVTAGTSRSFDMGSAKAAAEYVDMGPIRATRERLEEEYERMAVFEKQYGGRVLIEKRSRENWKSRRMAEAGQASPTHSPPTSLVRRRPQSAKTPNYARPKTPAVASPQTPELKTQRSLSAWEGSSERAAPKNRSRPASAQPRPSTAPLVRQTLKQRQAKALPDAKWQVSKDGRAVFSVGDAERTAINTGEVDLSLTGEAVTNRGSPSSQGNKPGKLASKLQSFPAGFRDPKNKRPEPEESIYGL